MYGRIENVNLIFYLLNFNVFNTQIECLQVTRLKKLRHSTRLTEV